MMADLNPNRTAIGDGAPFSVINLSNPLVSTATETLRIYARESHGPMT